MKILSFLVAMQLFISCTSPSMTIMGEVDNCNNKKAYICHNRNILDSIHIINNKFIFNIDTIKYDTYDIYIKEDQFFLPMPVKAHKGVVTMKIDYEKSHPMNPVYKITND